MQNRLKAEQKQAEKRKRIQSLGETDSSGQVADKVEESNIFDYTKKVVELEEKGLYSNPEELKNSKNRADNLKDIDKKVSLQIERHFEEDLDAIREFPKRDRSGFEFSLEGDIRITSEQKTKALESIYEADLGRLLSAYGISGRETEKADRGSDRETVAFILRGGIRHSVRGISETLGETSVPREIWEKALSVAMARRELEYRRIRRNAFRDRYGLNPGDTIPLSKLEEIFNATNTDKEVKALFDKVIDLAKSLGITVKVQEKDSYKPNSLGKATLSREIYLFVDPLIQ